jgi:GTP-binding protein Era
MKAGGVQPSTCLLSKMTMMKRLPHPLLTPPKPQRKRLDIALVGAPNAGKSQLLNSLIGSRSQSHEGGLGTDEGTRTGILGARTFDDTQLVFIDTPGFLHHKMGVKEGVRQLLGVAPSEMVRADETYLLLMRHGHWKRM